MPCCVQCAFLTSVRGRPFLRRYYLQCLQQITRGRAQLINGPLQRAGAGAAAADPTARFHNTYVHRAGRFARVVRRSGQAMAPLCSRGGRDSPAGCGIILLYVHVHNMTCHMQPEQ